MERAKLMYWLAAFSAVPPDPITAFLDHVESLLNTREGTLAQSPEYGVPQFDAVQGAQTLPNMARGIQKIVERYEPRLTVNSWSIGDDRCIQFTVSLSELRHCKDSSLAMTLEVISQWLPNGVIRLCH